MFHGLHDDDGVVDHDSDGEDEAKKRDRIEREPEGGHGGKRANEGYRNRYQRDNRGPPGLQKSMTTIPTNATASSRVR